MQKIMVKNAGAGRADLFAQNGAGPKRVGIVQKDADGWRVALYGRFVPNERYRTRQQAVDAAATLLADAAPVDPRAERRTYVVGLPVAITVDPDGVVSAQVDLSEASAIHEGQPTNDEGEPEYPADLVDADMNTIENAVIQALVKVSA